MTPGKLTGKKAVVGIERKKQRRGEEYFTKPFEKHRDKAKSVGFSPHRIKLRLLLIG